MAEFRKINTGKGFSVDSCLIGMKNDANGYPIGFFSMGNVLYRVTTCNSKKEGVDFWVKIEKCRAKPSK